MKEVFKSKIMTGFIMFVLLLTFISSLEDKKEDQKKELNAWQPSTQIISK